MKPASAYAAWMAKAVYSIVFEIRPYYGRITIRIVVLLAFAVRIVTNNTDVYGSIGAQI
jgi:hypothetical protein